MRAVVTLVIVAAAVLAQATVVNRLPFDWGIGPDLVVAAVVAVALTSSPAAAAACGFVAGLAVDILPPAEHAVGRYALILCLTAYVVALLRANTGAPGAVGSRASGWTGIGVAAVAALGAGLGYAVVGFVMGDPRMALTAVAVNVGVGALLTALVAPLVTVPLLWLRDVLTESEFATVQGPMSADRW